MIRFAAKPALPKPCLRSMAERLADDMREMAFAGQNVSPETLAQRGWSPAAVRKLGPRATQIARRAAVRHVEVV